MADWYYVKNGQKCGPVDTAALKQLAKTGQLQREDMIRREGMPNWVPASQQKGLFDLSRRTREPKPEGEVPTATAGQACPQGSAAGTPVTPLMVQHLLAVRPWVLFLSILGFIMCGIMCGLAGWAGLAMMASAVGGSRAEGFPLPVAAVGLGFLVLGGLYAAPAWLLYSYAAAIKRYRYSGSSGDMEAALRTQKSFWRFVGIVGIVMLSIYLLMLLYAIFRATWIAKL